MKRRLILWGLVLAFIWLLMARLNDIEQLARTLLQGQWAWVLAAAVLQLAYFVIFAWIYKVAFAAVGVESRMGELVPLTFSSIFINVAAPSGGMSGAALFVDDAARRGEKPARAAIGALLVLVADYGALALVLVPAMVFLFLHHGLRLYEILGALALLVMMVGLWAVLLMGLWQPERLHRLLSWFQVKADSLGLRLRRKPFLAPDWAERHAQQYAEASAALARKPRSVFLTILVALMGHLVNLLALYALFVAFHTEVGVGVLAAGYALGILFLIVSPTPMGIGFVEGIMTITFTSLGVASETATVVTLAFRGLSFWIPLLVGFLLLRRVKSFGPAEESRAEHWGVQLTSFLTAVMGVVNVLSAVTPSLGGRLALIEQFSPLEVRHGSHLAAALAGFALILLSRGLAHRKRTAWILTELVLVSSAVFHLVKGLDYEEAILALLLAAWLLYLRPHFHARSDPPSVRRGLRVLLAALLFTLFYGVAGFYLLDHHFRQSFGLDAAVRQTVVMFTQFSDPGLEPVSRFGRYFAASIYGVAAATFGYALWTLLRPVFVRHPSTATERAAAAAIVEKYGRTTLAQLALLPDKSYFFSDGGSVVAYTAKGRVAVALGDPIGPDADVAATIQDFQEMCARNDWQASFYQVLPDHVDCYRAAGFNVLCIGVEAIVDLACFNLSGRDKKAERSAINRLTREGYKTVIHTPPLPDLLLRELRDVSDAWLTMVHGTEKRFSLGWFEDDYIRHGLVMTVQDAEGAITAFANILPEFRKNETSVDLMRRRPDVEPGTMDFLFISLLQWAKSQGYATFNLGLSPLAGVGEQPDDPALEKAVHWVYEHVNQFYNFKGLHSFKQKFDPTWSPRYLAYSGTTGLLSVQFAITRASSGDSFILDYARDWWGSYRWRLRRAG